MLPKLKTNGEVTLSVDASVQIEANGSNGLRREIEQILADLNLTDQIKIDIK